VVLVVVVIALLGFYRYTRFGLAMRAAAFDQEAALTQGVSVGSVFAVSWAMAGALCAVAGSLLAISAGVDQRIWVVALIALPAIILGGLDSLEGAVIGGLAVGVVQSLVGTYQRDVAPWLGDNFAGASPYVLMMLVLLAKPYGIFGTPEVRRV
jgi:branched-chain amino acid transport system permease protein